MDVEPEFLKGELGGSIESVFKLGEERLIILNGSKKHDEHFIKSHNKP